jgi:hypothetical protein
VGDCKCSPRWAGLSRPGLFNRQIGDNLAHYWARTPTALFHSYRQVVTTKHQSVFWHWMSILSFFWCNPILSSPSVYLVYWSVNLFLRFDVRFTDTFSCILTFLFRGLLHNVCEPHCMTFNYPFDSYHSSKVVVIGRDGPLFASTYLAYFFRVPPCPLHPRTKFYFWFRQ